MNLSAVCSDTPRMSLALRILERGAGKSTSQQTPAAISHRTSEAPTWGASAENSLEPDGGRLGCPRRNGLAKSRDAPPAHLSQGRAESCVGYSQWLAGNHGTRPDVRVRVGSV